MGEVSTLVQMAVNDAWSNARLYRACLELPVAEFVRADRTSFFPSLRETLEHILLVERFYLDAVEQGGRGVAVYEAEGSFPDAEALWAAQHVEDQRLVAFVRGLSEPDLDREVTCAWARRETVRQILLHLLAHQLYHRGQAHAMLSGTVASPQLDGFFPASDRASA